MKTDTLATIANGYSRSRQSSNRNEGGAVERETSSFIVEWQYRLQIASVAAAGLLLSACGGGGGGGGESSSTKATACLNADLYDVGTHVDQSTLSPTEAVHTGATVMQETGFNSVPNLTETEFLEKTGLPQAPQIIYAAQMRQSYTRLDGTTLLTFGEITTPSLDPSLAPLQDPLLAGLVDLAGSILNLPINSGLIALVTTVTNTPAMEKRFDLSPGESYTQSYTAATNTSVTALDSTTIPLIIANSRITIKTTYVGRERITVTAGAFDTCKFIDEVTNEGAIAPAGSGTTTTWLAVGSGLLLKSETATGETTQLVNATIDGAPVQ